MSARGRRMARHAGGCLAVTAVMAGGLISARTGGDTNAGATSLEPTVETAWLPTPSRRGIMLADAHQSRAIAVVNLNLPERSTITQAGPSALVTPANTDGRGWLVDGRTWVVNPVSPPGTGDWFAVAGPGGAWLVSSEKAYPLGPTAPTGVGEPRGLGPGVTPERARVSDDGTLWVVEGDTLRGFSPRRLPPVTVPLGAPDANVALTLVDGDPVVIDRRAARHVDPATAAIDATWPLDLPAGPIAVAERNDEGVLAVRVADRLVITGPGRPAFEVEVDPDTAGRPPVMRNGLVYLTRSNPGEIVIVDPAAAPPDRIARRIPLAAFADITLIGHNRRIWYTYQDRRTRRTEAGVVTDALDVRPIAAPGEATGEPGDGADGAEPPPPSPPALDISEDGCSRAWNARRCPLDGAPEPESRARTGLASPACPRSWAVEACAIGNGPAAKTGPPNGGTGGNGPLGSTSTTTTTTTTKPPSSGGRRIMPPIVGKPLPVARQLLRDAEIEINPPHPRPANHPRDEVLDGVHYGEHRPQPGEVIPEGRVLDLDVADGTRPVQSIVSGSAHRCALTTDGRVSCWGDNGSGQLGNRDVPSATEPVPVQGLPAGIAVTAITAGPRHTCALLADETVWCWGSNTTGQLGRPLDPSSPGNQPPGPVTGIDHVSEVTASGDLTCARRRGSVWCWGSPYMGPSFPETTLEPRPTPRPLPRVVDAVELSGACARLRDTTVTCWSPNDDLGGGYAPFASTFDPIPLPPGHVRGDPLPVVKSDGSPLTGADEIASGSGLACARGADGWEEGFVGCWGPSPPGLPPTMRNAPGSLFGLHQAVRIAVNGQVCAVQVGGGVACLGSNAAAEVGKRSSTFQFEFESVTVQGLPGPAVDVFALTRASCALMEDGALWCWGQVAPDADPTVTPVPVPIPYR